MGPSAPEPTDPRKVIAAQQQANTQALQQSQGANQVNQGNAVGTQTWQLLGYDQNGNPKYGMSQQYNPQQQALQNFLLGSRSIGGATGNQLWDSLNNSGEYNQAFDPTQAVGDATSGRLGQMNSYMEPYKQKQIQDLDNQMRNQGLMPGMEAYDEQMRQIRDQQQQSTQSLLAQFQPQAFQQAYQEHNQPLMEAMELAKFGSPDALQFGQTPQYAQNAANAGQAYQNYDAQRMAQYQADQARQSGMFQALGSAGSMMLGLPPQVGAAAGAGIGGMMNGNG